MEEVRLSAMVRRGLEHARLVFGLEGSPVPAAELTDRGAAGFGAPVGGPPVGALLTNDRASVEIVLGALATGSGLVSLPLPGRAASVDQWVGFVSRACDAEGIEVIVARDDVAPLLDGLGRVVVAHSARDGAALGGPTATGFRLTQFSSGSTGPPSGVVLGDADLGANVDSILHTVRPRPGDATVSWLPLSHDMGLVGMLLTSLASTQPEWVGAGDIVLLDPETFLRSPSSWLAALDRWRGTFTAAPNFGYQMLARTATAGSVDLGHLRCAIVGGDIIRASTLRRVEKALGPSGWSPTCFCPAYGMAEVGLAVTMTPVEERWRSTRLDHVALADRRWVPDASGTVELVASGRTIAGYQVTVAGDEDAIGPLAVRPRSSGGCRSGGRPLVGADGLLQTTDVGFDDAGWLTVCGRDDDYVVARGRNLYGPAIEAAVGEVEGVRPGRVTAVGSPTGDWAIVVEVRTGAGDAEVPLAERIRRAAVGCVSARPDEVIVVAPGRLPMTSSGKVQRHEVARRWAAGTL